MLSRFLAFLVNLVQAADFHRNYNGPSVSPEPLIGLVDHSGPGESGVQLMKEDSTLGFRVMRGYVNSEELVMKFYSSHEDGERALQKQSDISKILNRESTAKLVKGCAPGLCAIMEDYIPAEVKFTNKHLVSLSTMVKTLYDAGWIHGDIRLCNVI